MCHRQGNLSGVSGCPSTTHIICVIFAIFPWWTSTFVLTLAGPFPSCVSPLSSISCLVSYLYCNQLEVFHWHLYIYSFLSQMMASACWWCQCVGAVLCAKIWNSKHTRTVEFNTHQYGAHKFLGGRPSIIRFWTLTEIRTQHSSNFSTHHQSLLYLIVPIDHLQIPPPQYTQRQCKWLFRAWIGWFEHLNQEISPFGNHPAAGFTWQFWEPGCY